MDTGKSKHRILELDALRGIAALIVVLFHYTLHRPEAAWGFKLGTTGVDLFFMISGFVILLTASKTTRAWDFVLSRFSRIYPAYWFCVCFTTILIIFYNLVFFMPLKGLFTQYLINMTMFQFYFRVADIDGPYWTMIIEMLFYFIILILIFVKKIKYMEYVSIFFTVLAFIYSIVLVSIFPAVHEFLNEYLPIINFFPLFAAGVFFYKIKTGNISMLRYIAVFVCLVVQSTLYDDGIRSKTFISQMEYNVMLCIYFILFILYVNGKLGFIVNRFSVFLGEISYSLYLVHQFLALQIIIPICMNFFKLPFLVASILVALPVTIGIAKLINTLVEKPAMSFLRRHYS